MRPPGGPRLSASAGAPARARARARPLTFAFAALAFAALAGGCALLVPGTLDDVRCTAEGAVGPPVCPTGTFCHDGTCRPGPPPLGEPCDADGVCGPEDHCVDPGRFGLPGDELCTRPCCSSADCGVGTGLVCAILGPGKLCVPAETLGRGEPGERFAGEPCERHADCRSAECALARGECVDACCTDAECGAVGAACRAGPGGWLCQPEAEGDLKLLFACETDADCASTMCVVWPDGFKRCVEPCCSSTDCGKVKVLEDIRNILCVPVTHNGATVHACADAVPVGLDRAVGEPCADDAECRSGRCVQGIGPGGQPTSKVCGDVCCTDASCGAPHLFVCAPPGGWDASGLAPASPVQAFDLQCVRR